MIKKNFLNLVLFLVSYDIAGNLDRLVFNVRVDIFHYQGHTGLVRRTPALTIGSRTRHVIFVWRSHDVCVGGRAEILLLSSSFFSSSIKTIQFVVAATRSIGHDENLTPDVDSLEENSLL